MHAGISQLAFNHVIMFMFLDHVLLYIYVYVYVSVIFIIMYVCHHYQNSNLLNVVCE